MFGGRYVACTQPIFTAVVWRESGKPPRCGYYQLAYGQITFCNSRPRSPNVSYLALNLPSPISFVADRNPTNDEFRSETSLNGSPRFNGLPDNCAEGQHDRPCGDAFRPCYEFVPPLRLVFAALLVVCVAFVCGCGGHLRTHLLCVSLVLPGGVFVADWTSLSVRGRRQPQLQHGSAWRQNCTLRSSNLDTTP